MKVTMVALIVGTMAAVPVFATPITYDVTGTFSDGGMLSGSFVADGCNQNPTAVSITTTAGSQFVGTSYHVSNGPATCDAGGGITEVLLENIQGFPSNFLELFFSPSLSGAGTFGIVNAKESTFLGVDQLRREGLIGSASSTTTIPEPATLALLSLGFTGLGFARRKSH